MAARRNKTASKTNSAPQSAFAAAVLDPAAPVPPGVAPGQEKRFNVYRNNVVVSLVEALGDAYPAVKQLVGEQFFNAAAGLFVRAHPPRSPLMILYGDGFGEWLGDFEPAASLPYLPDVARLERLLLEARNAADAEPLDAAAFSGALAGLEPEAAAALHFAPHPAARALASRFPIVSIHERALHGGGGALSGAETALVTRPADIANAQSAPPGTAAALNALQNCGSLGAAAEAAAAEGGEFGAVLTALLSAGALHALADED